MKHRTLKDQIPGYMGYSVVLVYVLILLKSVSGRAYFSLLVCFQTSGPIRAPGAARDGMQSAIL